MKFLSYITAFLVMVGSTCFGQGMRISAYPNTNNLGFSNLFIVAIKGSPGTNMNISWQQLSNLIQSTIGGQFILESGGLGTNTSIYNSLTVVGSNTITGNVGIGTNIPQTLLDVNGTALASYLSGTRKTRLIIEGDSLSTTVKWPSYVTNTWTHYLCITNAANSAGGTLAQITNEYSSEISRYSNTASILSLWIGANDIISADVTSWTTAWSNYVRTANNDGFDVVAWTIMPHAAALLTDSAETNRCAINNYIRRSTLPKYLVDIAAIFPNPLDTRYISDGTHLTTNGDAMASVAFDKALRMGRSQNNPISFISPEGTNFILRNPDTGKFLATFNDDSKVGIGTNAPARPLHVFGDIEWSGNYYTRGYGLYYNESMFSGYFGTASSIIAGAPSDALGLRSDVAIVFANSLAESARITNSSLAIGTNSPKASLHVAGGNAQDVAIIGTTNRPSLVKVSTNGVLSVNPGGGLNPVGCYGSLMMNATNLITCAGAAGVYTNCAGNDGYTTIVTNGFFGNTAAIAAGLTNLHAGWYKITICLSGQGANNQALEGEVFTNGVACDLIGFKKTYDAAARMDDISSTGIIYLPAACGTQFMVQDAGTGGDIIVHRASLTIGTP